MSDLPLHEIVDFLFLGSAYALRQTDHSFSLIVNCTKEGAIAIKPKLSATAIRVSINDDPAESDALLTILNDLDVLEQIHTHVQNQQKVLVHCMMGMQRSCAVVACYLMKYHAFTPAEVVTYIQSRRPIAFFKCINFWDAMVVFYFLQ